MRTTARPGAHALRTTLWALVPVGTLMAAAAFGGAPVGLPSGIGSGLHSPESSAPAKPEPPADSAPPKKMHKHKSQTHPDQNSSSAPSK